MSGFWESSLGEITGNESDAFAKSFMHIPDGTKSLACIDSFIVDEYNGNKFLKIEWILTDGDFKGQKVEQKIKVFGDPLSKDSSKIRHRSLNMLKLIYNLFDIKPTHSGQPSDRDLNLFVSKCAGIKIRETPPNDYGKKYNWVSEVHESKGFRSETGRGLTISNKNTKNVSGESSENIEFLDDDVPF